MLLIVFTTIGIVFSATNVEAFWRKNRSAELENVFSCPCAKNQCAPYVQKKKINPIGAGHSFSHLDDLTSGCHVRHRRRHGHVRLWRTWSIRTLNSVVPTRLMRLARVCFSVAWGLRTTVNCGNCQRRKCLSQYISQRKSWASRCRRNQYQLSFAQSP